MYCFVTVIFVIVLYSNIEDGRIMDGITNWYTTLMILKTEKWEDDDEKEDGGRVGTCKKSYWSQ